MAEASRLTVVGRLSPADWQAVHARLALALDLTVP